MSGTRQKWFQLAQRSAGRGRRCDHRPGLRRLRAAVAREIKHFILELAHYLESETPCDATHAYIQAEAMVTLVFNAGAEALDIEGQQREELVERVIWQLRYIARGALLYVRDNGGNEKS